MVSFSDMSGEQDVRKEQDLQLFSKRIDQLIRHKNHIIDILQEELEKGRKDVPETPDQKLKQLLEENASLRSKLATSVPGPELAQGSPARAGDPEVEQRLRRELETARSELERVRREEEIARAETDRAQREMDSAKAELDRLRQADSEAHTEFRDTQRQLDRFRTENAGLQSQVAQLGKRILDQETRLREKDELLKAAGGQNPEQRRLEAELASARKELDILHGQVMSLQQQVMEKERELRTVPAIRAQAQAESARVQADLAEASREIDRLRRLFEQSRQEEERLSQYADEIKRLRESSGAVEDEIRTLQQRAQDLQQQQLTAQEEAQQARDENRRLQSIVAEKTVALERLDHEKQALLEEQGRARAEAEDHQHANTRLLAVQSSLDEARQRETRLTREIQDLQEELKHHKERLKRFFVSHPQIIGYRPGDASHPVDAQVAEGSELEGPQLSLRLPFLFPERLPPPMRITWKPSSTYHLKPSTASPAPVFRITRPVRFFRIFRQSALQAPTTLNNRPDRLHIAPLRLSMRIREPAALPGLPPKKIILPIFPIIGMPMATLRVHIPVLIGPSRIALPRRVFSRSSYVWMMHIELLVQNLRESLQNYLRKLPSRTRTLETGKADRLSVPFVTSKKLEPLAIPAASLPPSERVFPARTPFDPAFPKGRLGMLMKGMEESLQSLNSRLDIGAHSSKPQSGS